MLEAPPSEDELQNQRLAPLVAPHAPDEAVASAQGDIVRAMRQHKALFEALEGDAVLREAVEQFLQLQTDSQRSLMVALL